MRIVALETSGRTGTIALAERGAGGVATLSQRALPPGQRTARTLLPELQAALAEVQWKPRDVQLVAVTSGPGSFTGLRIGVVAAKTLAYATGATLVGVPTLAALAEGAPAGAGPLWAVLDAQRSELFAARFDRSAPAAEQTGVPFEVLPADQWLARLSVGDAATGPPLAKLQERLPAGVAPLEPAYWAPAASAVARLGAALAARGETVDPLQLVPLYGRLSAAEEKASSS